MPGFVGGEYFSVDPINPQLLCDGLRRATIVARDHRHLNTEILEALNGPSSAGLDRIGHGYEPCRFTVYGDEHGRSAASR